MKIKKSTMYFSIPMILSIQQIRKQGGELLLLFFFEKKRVFIVEDGLYKG